MELVYYSGPIYMVFNDRLVIAYGKPRVRNVLFQQIDEVQILTLVIGNRLLVRLKSGRRLLLQPRDIEQFQGRFQSALDSYRRTHGSG